MTHTTPAVSPGKSTIKNHSAIGAVRGEPGDT